MPLNILGVALCGKCFCSAELKSAQLPGKLNARCCGGARRAPVHPACSFLIFNKS